MELGLTWPSIWMYLRLLIHSRTPARQPFLDSTKSSRHFSQNPVHTRSKRSHHSPHQSLFFLSSCFAKGINFRISQIGLLFLGASFVSNSICQRGLHLYPMLILLFRLNSGEPSMTLKVMTNKTLRQCLNSELLALRD
ncbi:hypothetical protein DVH24_023508 [Malus domestica]|uniref:Uncharacterized protein n=1 Tax=Malus domestica TaxID=3750 RepID=A0A498I4W6_MALDO|nr:hypothetical protein DVH24_023508 [Malus domestica]